MPMKIIYFTSEFPGQTHIFLWREYQELLRLGVSAHLVSTRKPPIGIQPHTWTAHAVQHTNYLFPLSAVDYFRAFRKLLLCPRDSWKKILGVILKTTDLLLRERVQLFAHLIMATKMADFVVQNSFTHVHCTTCAATANIAMFCRFLTGVQYSLSLLGPKLETYGPNQSNKWAYASFGLFQSQKLLKETQAAIPGSLPKFYAFAPVGVDTNVMRRHQPYQPWSKGDTCMLYSCGRLNPVKGHEYVIQAVGELIRRGYSIRLLIGGEDIDGGTGYRKTIEAEIRRNKLHHSVALLGAVSEEENIRQYQTAHIYVMGSLDEAAGAVAAMEAMAMELPVVMPNVGATHELIEHGCEGILVESKSFMALADAIEALMKNPDQAIQLGRMGRQKVQKDFNHHLSAQAIARFLALSHGLD